MHRALPPIRFPVSLRRLFPRASFVGCADIHVVDATEASGECSPNTLFAAIRGAREDGTRHAREATDRGATSLLAEFPLANVSVPQCIVPDVRKAFAELCAALDGFPSHRLKIAAVTGTNGKTTVTWLVRSMLQAAGKRTGLLGTIEYSDGRRAARAGLTTPDSKTLSEWLRAMLSQGTTHAAVELSSHALHQGRAAGTLLDVAVVTNITQDHFDYHGDRKSYRAAKAKIVDQLKDSGTAVLNADDPVTAELAAHVPRGLSVKTYGLESAADTRATILEESLSGSRFILRMGAQSLEVHTPLVGRHNISNCLAAATCAAKLGLDLPSIAAGVESLACVPGRLERVETRPGPEVFVDYAHTDDALRRSIGCLKELTQGRVICVFGAGGDRDRSKRPLLGSAAGQADLAVVTSDNPRTEDPAGIIEEIVRGLAGGTCRHHIECDRATAIRWALSRAEPGDCVIVAGKGHETEQIIGTKRIPFDDRAVVRDALLDAVRLPKPEPLRIPA